MMSIQNPVLQIAAAQAAAGQGVADANSKNFKPDSQYLMMLKAPMSSLVSNANEGPEVSSVAILGYN